MYLKNIINSLNDNVKDEFSKENIVKLLNSFYVVNCVTSVNSFDDLNKFISAAKTAMELAGFDLRGWELNGDNSHENQAETI